MTDRKRRINDEGGMLIWGLDRKEGTISPSSNVSTIEVALIHLERDGRQFD